MENTKTNAIRIIIFCIFIGAIVVIMSMIVGGTATSSKYNTFAQCISDKKLQFYGAFWCPHCQAQKAAFGDGAHLLPYIESSNADRSQNQTAIDAKIESYPTWVYPSQISMTSKDAPIVCPIQPGPAGQPQVCAEDGSRYFKTWIFNIDNAAPQQTVKIQSATDPAQNGTNWIFNPGARSVGELDTPEGLKLLSDFSSCPLPSESTAK